MTANYQINADLYARLRTIIDGLPAPKPVARLELNLFIAPPRSPLPSLNLRMYVKDPNGNLETEKVTSIGAKYAQYRLRIVERNYTIEESAP